MAYVNRRGVLVPDSVETEELRAEKTATQPFAWMQGGLERSDYRGIDEPNSRADLQAEYIDTARHRDPVIFRAVDYYDKLPLGSGLTIESKNEAVLLAAKRFWRANQLESVQHQVAIELAQTAIALAWIPKDVPPTGAEAMSYTPALELVPTGQINRIATRAGRPWYFRRRWQERQYPDPNEKPRKSNSSLSGIPVWMEQDLLAEDCIYVAINRGARELRGVSMLQPALYWTKLYSRTLQTVYTYAVAKAWLALHIKISKMGGDGDPQLEELRSRIENTLVNTIDATGESYKVVNPGQALITSDNVQADVLSSKVGADSDDSEKRRLLLQAAVATGLPEVFLSDGDYSNLASSMTQSNPFFRLMESHQTTLIDFFRRVFEKALDRYRDAGWLQDIPLKPGMTHLADYLTITAPDILTPDAATMGPVAATLVQAGTWSHAEANRQLGTDWKKIQAEIEEEKKAGLHPAPAPAGLPAFPFGAFSDANTRTETETLADRMRKKSERAVSKFKSEMAALGQGSRDKTRAMELYLQLVKELKSILKQSQEKGQKVGYDMAPDAPEIEREPEEAVV